MHDQQPSLNVRTARLEDVDHIARLLVEAELCKPEGLTARIERSITASPDTCLVAEQDGVVIGAVLAVYNGFHIFMSLMAVSAAHRGHGVGHALHEQLLAVCARLGGLGIITDSWLSAAGFYYELGYRMPGAVFLIRDTPDRSSESLSN